MDNMLIQQGVDLMIFGVGVVFLFLIILVSVTSIMSQVIMKFFPEVDEIKPSSVPIASSRAAVDTTVLKVIQAAIDLHRGRK
jgi:oxaloacetate decarboxylase gamma subunit